MGKDLVSLPPESLPAYQAANDLDLISRTREMELEDIIRSRTIVSRKSLRIWTTKSNTGLGE
jgi:hypothetical protein